MRLIKEEEVKKPPVVIEFEYEEALQMARSVMNDITWSETHASDLYSEFHSTLLEGLLPVDRARANVPI